MTATGAVHVIGGRALQGVSRVQGCKNTSLAVLSAAHLTRGPVHFRNLPAIGDFAACRRIAEANGYVVTRRGESDVDWEPDSERRAAPRITASDGAAMRASTTIAAALLARDGSVSFPVPGGDDFCARPIDRHLAAMVAAGALIEQSGGRFRARLPRGRAQAFTFSAATGHGPSLGATVTALALAAIADGDSRIHDPSPEPEIDAVVRLLNACGARIEKHPEGGFAITGVTDLSGTDFVVPGDRHEAGTLALASAATGGSILIQGVTWDAMSPAIGFLHAIGCTVKETADGIHVAGSAPLRGAELVAEPRPGFSTDLQPQATAVLAAAAGRSWVRDTVFPGRTSHLPGLRAMGARIVEERGGLLVDGVNRLEPADVRGTDIRCATALVIAALTADGESRVHGVNHIRRGHADLLGKLRDLGAIVWTG